MNYVILVEDNEDIRSSLEGILADEGYEVAGVRNGLEALELLERRPPCLMVVDLLMPVMDGVELIERMRKDARFEDIPVLVLSAASTVEPPPGTSLLPKPPRYEALMAEIRKHCPCEMLRG